MTGPDGPLRLQWTSGPPPWTPGTVYLHREGNGNQVRVLRADGQDRVVVDAGAPMSAREAYEFAAAVVIAARVAMHGSEAGDVEPT